MTDQMSWRTLSKLRIAWSVAWGIATVTSIVLWMRSYQGFDRVTVGALTFASARGHLLVAKDFRMTVGFASFTPVITGMKAAYSASLPTWMLTSVAAAFCLAPWLYWKFSLRTLLIATMLVAICLGTIVYVMR